MKKTDLINAGKSLKRSKPTLTPGQKKVQDTAAEACLRLATVLDVIADIEDIVGQKGEPCPMQSQTAVKKLRELLGIKAHRAKKAKPAKSPEPPQPVEVDPASEMTCGKPPYVAEIVRVSGDTVWTATAQYRSERAAESAILQRAALLKHPCSGYVRHWITEKAEHILDYGSHSFYGRIMTAENWRNRTKEGKCGD